MLVLKDSIGQTRASDKNVLFQIVKKFISDVWYNFTV